MMQIELKSYLGPDIIPLIDALADFRIEGFRAFPYLYEGSIDYERKYLANYSKDKNALLVCAWSGDILVGVATSLPLTKDSEITLDILNAMQTAKKKPQGYYYYSEIIVKPKYRGMGIARDIYQIRQSHAVALGMSDLCLAIVERPTIHLLRPSDYVSPEVIWVRDGFEKTDITFSFRWPTIQSDGTVRDEKNMLRLWTKSIGSNP